MRGWESPVLPVRRTVQSPPSLLPTFSATHFGLVTFVTLDGYD
ncbi:hypothetical protein SAMN03159338_0880 [Sphingomonas sp. NFR04]|nr:hypothetical protein SAMN03159338_0880 [Sphingomonas sp. NFR04]